MRLFIAFFTIMALMAVALMPLDMALGQGTNLTRALPSTPVERGQTFNVTVTFTAPADNFNSIGLTDNAPDGWNVAVNAAWCTPNADFVSATGNKTEIAWTGQPVGFNNGTTFTAVYKVTVANYACAGNHAFNGSLEYYLGPVGPSSETVIGDSEVEVPVYGSPLICCSLKSLSFNAIEGGPNPANQTLEISNSGVGTISWTLSDNAGWLSENPPSGSSTSADDKTLVTVSVNTAGMPDGDYPANITITAPGASNNPQVIPVSLHISLSTSEISFWPESFSFTAVAGGSNPVIKMLDIWNSGTGTLNWTLTDDAAWLSENPTGGNSTSIHDTVALSVNITGMSAGDYSANINITSPGVSNSPQVVPVSLHISSVVLEISFNPESFSFTAVEGGSTPANQTLEIWNSGGERRDWYLSDDAAWLSEIPTSGSSKGEHDTAAVLVDIAGMSAGDYSANITITSPGASNSPQVVPVSLHISSAAPEISFSPESLSFTAGEGGSNETLEIWNSGIDTLNWTLTDDAAWLSENATSGSSTSADDKTVVTVSVNTAGMSAGNYSANITITSPGASNSPQTVPVSLHIGGVAPPPSLIPAWLIQYWWAIVAGIVVVVLLVYLLRRRRSWA